MITLILGGTKSGKSDAALALLRTKPKPWVMIPTGRAQDADFREQIKKHQQDREPDIMVFEVDVDLPEKLTQFASSPGTLVVDSLDFWYFAATNAGVGPSAVGKLTTILSSWTGPDLIIVSSEIGLGPLPASRETRLFARGLGDLNQALARLADEVCFVVAGLSLSLK